MNERNEADGVALNGEMFGLIFATLASFFLFIQGKDLLPNSTTQPLYAFFLVSFVCSWGVCCFRYLSALFKKWSFGHLFSVILCFLNAYFYGFFCQLFFSNGEIITALPYSVLAIGLVLILMYMRRPAKNQFVNN